MPGTGDSNFDHDNLGAHYNAAAQPQLEEKPDPLAHLSAAERRFAENPDVADALKELFLTIIPDKDFEKFSARLDRGDYDAHLDCAAHPMGGLLAQVAAMPKEHGLEWFKAIAKRDALDINALEVPYFYNGNSYVTTIKGYSDQSVSRQPLGARLIGSYGIKMLDLAAAAPRLLAHETRNNEVTQPIAHHLMFNETISLQRVQMIADKTGSLDFIDIRNAAGESIFYRLATNKDWYNTVSILNVAGWLLERRPELANTTDAAGWTPLDRYVLKMTAQTSGQPAVANESGMLRLLMSAGAQFAKQTPPGISLADYHAQHADRASLRKPIVAPKPR